MKNKESNDRQATVFIVDDDLGFQSMMEEYLHSRHPHYVIRIFSSGEDCLENLHLRPDAIILDYYLDGIQKENATGLEVLKQLKSKAPDIPVIMLSGQGKFGVAAETLMKGAYDYIIKDEEAFRKANELIEKLLAAD